MKILLAVDGSAYTQHMLAYVAAHAEWLNPAHRYTVVHAVSRISARAASALSRESLDSYYRDESESVFEPIRVVFAGHGITPEFIGLTGHVADEIAKYADAGQFDLLIMGSHGQGSIRNLVMGSVATKVLAGCKVPVLLVR
jgi:nucleotide-binding universal stress UspA family protein